MRPLKTLRDVQLILISNDALKLQGRSVLKRGPCHHIPPFELAHLE